MEEIIRKTLLYKSGVEYADYSLNHAEGCSHGCTYPCYAMMIKKRSGVIKDYTDWKKPKIVSNALELLDKEIPKYKSKIKYVYLSFATDPFMYKVPEVTEISLKIIKRLNQDNIKVVSITKGIYPKDLTDKKNYGSQNEYGITLVSLSEQFKNRFEPFASPIKERIASLKYLHNRGMKTWVSIEPYPTPNVIKQDIEKILEAVSFADKIVFGKWNYNYMIGNYADQKTFYNEMAYKVITFCNKKKIDIHIKKGTIDLEFLKEQALPHKQTYYKTLLSYNAV
ncbi:MAG: radical SAM protein [Candidatus Schekmanbacteria bacterium]|nr:radical SAM protein [Candidatus Schekmanbacteria bacterium]